MSTAPTPPRSLAMFAAAVTIALSLSGCSSLGEFVGHNLDRAFSEGQDDSTQDEGSEDTTSDDEDFAANGETSDEGNTDIVDLEIGQCVNDASIAADEDVTTVMSLEVVPCDAAHDSEVFAFVDYSGDDYPDDETVAKIADEGCFDQFETYTGSDYDTSTLEFDFYTPTRQSWKYGDRSATCVLFDMDLAKLTGSAKDGGI